MKLSVIIPMYNVEKYIGKCLDSVINQDLLDSEYEIIVINDGSTDDSYALAITYADSHNNIILLNQENKGISAARNKGIDEAKGKYLYFVDSDDYIRSNVLKTLLNYLNLHNLQVLAFNIVKVNGTNDNEGDKRPIESYQLSDVTNGITFMANKGFRASVCWFILEREFLLKLKLRFIEGVMLEDVLFNANLFTQVSRIASLPVDIYYYLIHPNSIMRKRTPGHYLKMVKDYEFVVIELNSIIKEIETQEIPNKAKFIKGMKSLQGVFLNYLFVRMMRSNVNFNYINHVIKRLKNNELYPIQQFNKNKKDRLMLLIFNNKIIFYPFLIIYRFFSKRRMLNLYI